MNKRITNIIMGLLVVLLMGILVGCPTEAPKPKDKSGDDGGGDPIPEVSISLTHIGSHEIVATTSVNIDIAGEVTFVITESETKPTIPDTEVFTDGFITRKFDKGETRDVYMAQLGTNLPNGDGLGTLNNIKTLHPAYMRDNIDYYLHTFYTKQGDDDVTHTSKPFKTTAHRTKGDLFDMVQKIEYKVGKENLTIFVDVYDTERSSISVQSAKLGDGAILGIYSPPVPISSVPADISSGPNADAIFFDDQYLFVVRIRYPESIEDDRFGTWQAVHSDNDIEETFTVTKITD